MKYIHTILIALLLSSTLFAQETGRKIKREKRKEKMESRIESQKIAFLTQKLDLTPSEAQVFWPIYNEYQAKMKEARQQNKMDWTIKDVSDDEANEVLDNLLKREQNELDIKKQYLSKLKTVVPARKVAQLYILEKQFREEILAKIRNKISQKKRKAKRDGAGF
jgi:hypothetical protein